MTAERLDDRTPPLRAQKTLRDEYALAIVPALLCQRSDWTPKELARETLDIANAILATRAEDKKAYLRGKHDDDGRDYDGDARGNN